MRWMSAAAGMLVACGPVTRPYPDDVALGTLCTTVKGQEHCADGPVTGARTADGFRVEALVRVPEMQLGYDRVPVWIEAGADGARFALGAPLAVVCSRVQAHGDHCHPGVPVPMACALEADAGDAASVELVELADDRVYARFEGRFEVDAPPCCQNQCAWHLPAEPDLSGPYRFTGVVHAALLPEG